MSFEAQTNALGGYLVTLYKEVKLVYYSIEFVKNKEGKLINLKVWFSSESTTLASGKNLKTILSCHYLEHLKVHDRTCPVQITLL